MSSNIQDSLYIAVTGRRSLAGPGYVTCIKFLTNKQPGPPPTRAVKHKYKPIVSYLDTLEEGKDYLVKSIKIDLPEIYYKGFFSATSKKVIDITAQLSYQWKCNKFILCSRDAVGGLYFDYDLASKTDWRKEYCHSYCRYIEMFWMKNYYHGLYPEYNFDENYGRATNDHLDTVLQIGITKLHRLDNLTILPKRWLELIRQNDLWALTDCPYYRQNPKWWPKKYIGYNFIYCLEQKEIDEIIKVFYKTLTGEHWFMRDLKKDYPDITKSHYCGRRFYFKRFHQKRIKTVGIKNKII